MRRRARPLPPSRRRPRPPTGPSRPPGLPGRAPAARAAPRGAPCWVPRPPPPYRERFPGRRRPRPGGGRLAASCGGEASCGAAPARWGPVGRRRAGGSVSPSLRPPVPAPAAARPPHGDTRPRPRPRSARLRRPPAPARCRPGPRGRRAGLGRGAGTRGRGSGSFPGGGAGSAVRVRGVATKPLAQPRARRRGPAAVPGRRLHKGRGSGRDAQDGRAEEFTLRLGQAGRGGARAGPALPGEGRGGGPGPCPLLRGVGGGFAVFLLSVSEHVVNLQMFNLLSPLRRASKLA